MPESVHQGSSNKGNILSVIVGVNDKDNPGFINGGLPGSYPGSYMQLTNGCKTGSSGHKTSGLPGSYPGVFQSQRQISSQALPKEISKVLSLTKDDSCRKADNGKYIRLFTNSPN